VRRGLMFMRWHDLLFMHWPVPADALRPLIPSRLGLDTFGKEAWLGIVPFYMTGVRPRFVPPIPGISAFAELNVRTYVTADDKPGVWFFSLDAASKLAVRAARPVEEDTHRGLSRLDLRIIAVLQYLNPRDRAVGEG